MKINNIEPSKLKERWPAKEVGHDCSVPEDLDRAIVCVSGVSESGIKRFLEAVEELPWLLNPNKVAYRKMF